MPEELKDKTEPTASRVMRTPREADVDITSRCNLRCRYCYFFDISGSTATCRPRTGSASSTSAAARA